MRSAELTPIRYEALSAPADHTAEAKSLTLISASKRSEGDSYFRCHLPPPAPPAAFA